MARLALGAFLVLVFSLGFMQPSIWILDFQIPLTDFIFVPTFLIWLTAFAFKKVEIRFGKFYLPLIAYLLALILSTVFSDNPKQSFFKLLGEIYLIGLACLTYNLIRTIADAKKVVFVWLSAAFIGCLISAISVLVFYTDRANPFFSFAFSHYGTLPPGNYPRIHSTFLNANMFCNYLNVSLMFALAASRLDWINKKIFLIFLIFFSLAAFFTLSPGIGGILLAAGLWFWQQYKETGNYKRSKLSLWLGGSAAFLFFCAVLFAPNENALSPFRFNFFGNIIYPSERVLAWQASIQTFTENPFFGRGLGLDVVAIFSVIASGQKHFIGDSHQLWLNIAGQCGIVGLIAIGFLCYFFYRKALPLKFDNEPPAILRLSFGLAFIGAFLYQGLSGSFEDARHLWLLIGLLGSFGE